MIKEKVVATALAMSIGTTPISFSRENKNNQQIFNPQITQYLQNAIDRYNEEQERLAYEEWLRQNPQFPKYNLSEDQLIQITRLCQQEQGSLEGVAAEATLMANRKELHGKDFRTLDGYLRNSGWFANASYFMDYGNYSKEGLEIVRQVLVEGKRTMPRYIDEHDSIGDISYNTDGLIPFETKVHNVYGGAYTYYDTPGSSDPFGYTSEALREQYGDAHYEFTRLLEK